MFLPLQYIGRQALDFFQKVGILSIFIAKTISGLIRRPFYLSLILRQIISIGYFSLPVVAMTAVFSGAVLALQSYTGFSRFSAESSIATVVVLSITRELGPVLAGLMVAGRVGASIAAEIGTMKVTEQIEAMEVSAINPLNIW